MQQRTRWLALILSLPTRSTAARMRVWRALKSVGCGILRDGVYVLPATASTEQALLIAAKDVLEVSGTAHLLELVCRSEAQAKKMMALFDRSRDYAALVKTIHQTTKKNRYSLTSVAPKNPTPAFSEVHGSPSHRFLSWSSE